MRCGLSFLLLGVFRLRPLRGPSRAHITTWKETETPHLATPTDSEPNEGYSTSSVGLNSTQAPHTSPIHPSHSTTRNASICCKREGTDDYLSPGLHSCGRGEGSESTRDEVARTKQLVMTRGCVLFEVLEAPSGDLSCSFTINSCA